MRTLLFHCKKISLISIHHSSKEQVINNYENALCVFITIELGDDHQDITAITNYIIPKKSIERRF